MRSSAGKGCPRVVVTRVYCAGNSLTKGDQGTPYPTALAGLLGSTVTEVLNWGINGHTTTQWVATDFYTYAGQVFAGFRNVVVFWELTNDIWFDSSTSSAQAMAKLQTMCAMWRALGAKVIVPDIIARTDFSAGQRTIAGECNVALASTWQTFADGYVPLSARFTDYTDETVYYPDHLHLNTNGYSVVAGLVKPEVTRVISLFQAS